MVKVRHFFVPFRGRIRWVTRMAWAACRVPRTALPSTASARPWRRPWPCPWSAARSRAPSQDPTPGVKGGCVHGFQDPADGCFTRRLESPRHRIMADAETGQDLRRRVRHPLADGRE